MDDETRQEFSAVKELILKMTRRQRYLTFVAASIVVGGLIGTRYDLGRSLQDTRLLVSQIEVSAAQNRQMIAKLDDLRARRDELQRAILSRVTRIEKRVETIEEQRRRHETR